MNQFGCLATSLWRIHFSLCLSAQEHVHSQFNSQYIKAKVNSSHLTKKMEIDREALKKAKKRLAVKEQDLAEGKQQMEELERSWRNFEKAAREKVSRERDIELDEDQVCVDVVTVQTKAWICGVLTHLYSETTCVKSYRETTCPSPNECIFSSFVSVRDSVLHFWYQLPPQCVSSNLATQFLSRM